MFCLFLFSFSKKDPILLTKAIGTLAYMLDDDNVNVMKRVMLACTSMYKVSLQVSFFVILLITFILHDSNVIFLRMHSQYYFFATNVRVK